MEPQEKLLLSIKEAGVLCSVNYQTIRKWIDQKLLKTFHVGKIIRIKKSDLLEFVEKAYK